MNLPIERQRLEDEIISTLQQAQIVEDEFLFRGEIKTGRSDQITESIAVVLTGGTGIVSLSGLIPSTVQYTVFISAAARSNLIAMLDRVISALTNLSVSMEIIPEAIVSGGIVIGLVVERQIR